ncbi:MAG: homocysteine S-methyltransferase family protein [Acidobacteriota bacterium]
MTPDQLARWLAARPRVLDGAMGSELLRRGVTEAEQLWGVGALLRRPEAVRAIHRDHAIAGAEALTAATFRVAPYALRRVGQGDHAARLASLAIELARAGASDADRDALVFASQTTLEDCYRPDLVPSADVLEREHASTSLALASAGPDALLLETFNTIGEARTAARAAAATGMPVLVTFTCMAGGRLLSGEDAGAAAAAVSLPGVVALGVNCTRRRDVMAALVRMAPATDLPLVAYANDAWYGTDSAFLTAAPSDPESYACAALAWSAAGARLVGGCCGTRPEHVAAVAAALRHES